MIRSACSAQIRRRLQGNCHMETFQMGFSSSTRIKAVVSDVDWERILKDADEKKMSIVAEFTATWCPPCRMIHPILEELAGKYSDVMFLKLDIDDPKVLPVVTKHNVSSVPTFVSYRGRTRVATFSGADKGLLASMVQEVSGD